MTVLTVGGATVAGLAVAQAGPGLTRAIRDMWR
jgi:hypothetical protein